jgi:cobalt-zinc-cadmium resistance protein CzcA
MFEKIIRFSIDQRWLVLLMTLGMARMGVFSYQKLPIDAVPDITNVQVQINTAAPGYSPLEVRAAHHVSDRDRHGRLART